MGRLIAKAELARWANVSRQAVFKLCVADGPLFDATAAGKVDVEHPLVRAWLGAHGVDKLPDPPAPPAHRPKTRKRPASAPPADGAPTGTAETPRKLPPPPTADTPYELRDLEDLTVREVVMRYGSIDGFKRFVDSLKNIAEYKHRELRVRQQRGDLIERAAVAGLVFPMIDVAFQRLVADVPESVSKLVVARCEAGGPETAADVTALIRDANSRVLQNLKQSATRSELLTNAN